MGQTIVEKIISNHADKAVYEGELVIARVDTAMASDTTGPLTIKAFRAMGGKTVWNPKRCILVIDHAAPAPNERISNLHLMMREFAREQKCVFFEAGTGICHQLLIEKNMVRPGQITAGADSHSTSYGAVGALGTGVGSTDLAAVLLTGKIWLKVPGTIKIEITGDLPEGLQSKDLILTVLRETGIAGATYQAMEFSGETISRLTLSGRITVANMIIEAGAKTGFVHTDGLELPYDLRRCCRTGADDEGFIGEPSVNLMKNRAEGGVGLIITGYAYISKSGQSFVDMNGIHTDEHIARYTKMTQAVHEARGRIVMQIAHCGTGSETTARTGGDYMAISVTDKMPNYGYPAREMTAEDIQDIIDSFDQPLAARRCSAGRLHKLWRMF